MRFTDINISKDIKLSEYYNKKITISFNETGKPVRFQIPRMYMPFGVSGFTPEIGNTKWNIDFNMSGWNQPDNYIKKYFDFIKNIEKFVMEFIKENSLEIFGCGSDSLKLENMFNSNIKEDGREPKFRLKVDTDSVGFIKPPIFNIDNKNITSVASKGLYKGQTGVSTIELTSVYFMNKKFGLTWRMCQMKVYEPQRLHGFQFQMEDEPDPDDEPKLAGFQFQM